MWHVNKVKPNEVVMFKVIKSSAIEWLKLKSNDTNYKFNFEMKEERFCVAIESVTKFVIQTKYS